MRISLVILSLVTAYVLAKQEIYPCFTDMCNVDTGPQFCSSTFKLCRDCKEIIQDCYTPKQPRNCSKYCEANLCTDVERMLTIANGNASAQQYNGRSMIVGSEIIYGCNAGYKIDGSTKIMCLGNNTWSEKSVPVCFHRSQLDMAINQAFESKKMEEENYCVITPLMLNIDNGQVTSPEYNDNRISAGSEMLYHCDKGYTLEGFELIRCLGNGTWSHNTLPYCMENSYKENYCVITPLMLNIENGKVTTLEYNESRISAGSEMLYHCNNGYTLEGFELIRCLGNGTWSQKTLPYCMSNSWKGFKHATVALSCTCVALPVIVALILYRLAMRRKTNTRKISRASTEDSLDKEKQSLIPEQKPTVQYETETPSPPPEQSENNFDNKRAYEPSASSNILPSAPPAEPNEVENEPKNERTFPSQDQNAIDEKQSTEETNEVNTVQETPSEKEENGTEPLAARDVDHLAQPTDAEDLSKGKERGPQVVPSQEVEPNRSPTEETGNGKKSDMVAVNDVTFPRNDIKRIERQAEEADDIQRLDELKEVDIE